MVSLLFGQSILVEGCPRVEFDAATKLSEN
jgi:hypothetical protein